MARGDGSGGLTFELVPDDDPDESLVVVGPAEGEQVEDGRVPPSVLTRAARASLTWLRGQSPRRLVAAGLVLALVIAGAGLTSVLRERAREARLLAAPGGVVDLSHPLSARWGRTFQNGTAWPFAAFEDGTVLVAEYPYASTDSPPIAVRAGDTSHRAQPVLHALDPRTGRDRWSATLEPGATCGQPFSDLVIGRTNIPVVTTAVCLAGSRTGIHAVLVDAAGTTTRRELDGVGPDTQVLLGPAGHLVRVDRDGTVQHVPSLEEDSFGGWHVTGTLQPADVRLALEDALTGRVRWHRELAAREVQSQDGWWGCVSWGSDGRPEMDPAAIVSWSTSPEVLSLITCGVEAAVTTSGRVVAQAVETTGGGVASPVITPLADGGVGVADATGPVLTGRLPTDVQDASGRVVRSVERGVLDPWSTDGPADVTVGIDRDAAVAFDHDGHELWRNANLRYADGALVRGAGVLVVVRWAVDATGGQIVGVDMRTGHIRWKASLNLRAGVSGGGAWAYARAAWTDGRLALLVTPGNTGDPSVPTWTAYDLRTGLVAWRIDSSDAAGLVSAQGACGTLAGRLVCYDGSRVSLLE